MAMQQETDRPSGTVRDKSFSSAAGTPEQISSCVTWAMMMECPALDGVIERTHVVPCSVT
jgi:hypothetical protein